MSEKNETSEGQVPSALWDLLTDVMVTSMRHLEGQLCTFVDSTTGDERQAKAAKDIVKTLLWAYEREAEKHLEGYLFMYSQSPRMELFPDWLKKRLKKENS